MSSESRKKVQLYIYPEQKPQDKVASDFFTEMPTGLRAQAYRNSLVSGVALAKIDPRLPEILAVALSTNPDGEELKKILISVIGSELASSAPVSDSDSHTTPETAGEVINGEEGATPEPAQFTPPAKAEATPDAGLSGDELQNISKNFAV